MGERESIKEVRLTKHNIDNISLSDQELRYLVENSYNYDTTLLIEQIIDIFKRYKLVYILLKLSEFCLAIILIGLTFDKKEIIIDSLIKMYTDLDYGMANIIFYFIMTVTCSMSTIFYIYGAYSLYTLNVRSLKLYNSVSLFSSISTILLVYVNM